MSENDWARTLSCEEVVEFLDRYLATELAYPVRRQFERHLEACRDCRIYVTTYRVAVELGRTVLDAPEVPTEIPDALVRAIVAARFGA